MSSRRIISAQAIATTPIPTSSPTPSTADAMQDFLDVLGLKRYTLYMTDFGGPVEFRLMERDPKAIEAIIVQNANCYLEGFTPARQTYFRRAHDDRSPEGVAFVYDRTGADSIINQQYLRDVPPERREIMNPDSWASDLGFLTTEKDRKIQVQLLRDYQNNIDRYPAWQAVLREHQFPALIVWGKNDQGFIAPGAEAYLRDLPHAELHLIDAGHFAVEEKPAEIAAYLLNFMKSRER
jgi:pimeloyl-ACP methyl ester carboxylesterase